MNQPLYASSDLWRQAVRPYRRGNGFHTPPCSVTCRGLCQVQNVQGAFGWFPCRRGSHSCSGQSSSPRGKHREPGEGLCPQLRPREAGARPAHSRCQELGMNWGSQSRPARWPGRQSEVRVHLGDVPQGRLPAPVECSPSEFPRCRLSSRTVSCFTCFRGQTTLTSERSGSGAAEAPREGSGSSSPERRLVIPGAVVPAVPLYSCDTERASGRARGP